MCSNLKIGESMALFISENKGFELTAGEKKVLEKLKKLYSEVEHSVYIYAQGIVSNKRPDFVIIDEKRGVSIIEVKDWERPYILMADRKKVTLQDGKVDNPIVQVNGYCDILSGNLSARDFGIDKESIARVIAFVNMGSSILEDNNMKCLYKNEIKYIFKDTLSVLKINDLFNPIEEPYTLDDIRKIRIALYPEIEIVTVDSNINDQLDIKALDYEQEAFAKRIPLGNYMVTGVPGSGKTVMLLSRAIYLMKENPDWKILILTYNKSLSAKLNNKLNRMAENFKFDAFYGNIAFENIMIKNFHGLTSQLTNGMKIPANMDKTQWFQYEVVNLALEKAIPTYDAILIDEYQDFRMNWIKLCVKLCKDYTLGDKVVKNIFLAGDRLQSIYTNDDVSFKDIGINMQGRSKFLKTSYRSAKQHMTLALKYLANDPELRKDVEKFYVSETGKENLEAINSGSVEFIEGNYRIIGEMIRNLKTQGYTNEDFLILASSEKICRSIINSCDMNIKGHMTFVRDITEDTIQNNIVVTTYHSSKGLEAKIVFLTSPDSIYMGASKNQKEHDILKKKAVYVGITRASEKLFVHCQPEEQSKIVSELNSLIKQ